MMASIRNYWIRSSTSRKRTVARPSTVILAVDVNPFLLFDNLSRILFDLDIVFTMDMLDICTDAHPILKSAGSVMYHASSNCSFSGEPSAFVSVMPGG